MAVFLGPVTTIPILLFSGFFVNFNNIPSYLQPLAYAAYVRYAFSGTLTAIYGMNRTHLECEQAYCHHRSPAVILEEMDVKDSPFWIDVVALSGCFIVLRILGFVMLKWKLRSMK